MFEHKLIGTEVLIDTGFSKTVDEKYLCTDGQSSVIITRQVYSDYSYSVGNDDGPIISATSWDEAIRRAEQYVKDHPNPHNEAD